MQAYHCANLKSVPSICLPNLKLLNVDLLFHKFKHIFSLYRKTMKTAYVYHFIDCKRFNLNYKCVDAFNFSIQNNENSPRFRSNNFN